MFWAEGSGHNHWICCFSTLAWLLNEQYYWSQNGNQFSDLGFCQTISILWQIPTRSLAWLTENKQKISSHCVLFKAPWPRCSIHRTVNEQTPQLPEASALITPIQQNRPSNCPDQYYLLVWPKLRYSSKSFPRQLEVFVTYKKLLLL